MKNKKSGIGFGWIAAGLVFLFNPCVHIIDVLPDFIGLLLILFGLDRLRDISPHIANAYVGFTRAAYVETVKFLFFFISGKMDGYMLVVLSISAGLLECIFLIPAMKELFTGTDDLRLRLTDRSDESASSSAGTLSAIFFIARAALAAVPVFSQSISDSGYYGEVTSGKTDIGSGALRTALIIICCALALALGIVWLTTVEKYIASLRRDGDFCAAAAEKYAGEVLSDGTLLRRRRVGRFSALYVMAFAFLFCLRFDSHYPVPEFLFGAFVLIAAFLAGDFAEKADRKKIALPCAIQIASATAAYILLWIYGDRFGDSLYPYEEKGFYALFLPYCAAMIISLISTALVTRKARKIQNEMTERCVGWGIDSERRKEIDSARKNEIRKKINVSYILSVIYCAVSALCMASIPFDGISDAIALSWAIRSAACAALIISVYICSAEIRSEAEK